MKNNDIDDIQIISFDSPLNNLQEKITKKLKEIREDLKISFIGRVSTGKSSIINSILGIDLLPVSTGQTTLYSIFISGIIDNIFRVKEGEGNWKYFESIDEIKNYLLEIQNENILKIEINLPVKNYKILEKCTFIDNPAIGYSDELDEYVLNQCYRSCYLYVLVIDAVASISIMEKKFLSALHERRRISEIKVLLNFSDCIKEDELNIALGHHKKSLKISICNSEKLFVFSGYAYTENQTPKVNTSQYSTNSQEDLVTMKKKHFSGEQFVKDGKIIKFLQKEPPDEEMKGIIKKLQEICENHKSRIERFIKCYAVKGFSLAKNENDSQFSDIFIRLCKLDHNQILEKEYKNKIKMGNYKFFLNTIALRIEQIDKVLSQNSVDILKNQKFLDLWKKLENKWNDDVLEWNLRCILFFTEILLIVIQNNKTIECNSAKEFAIKILTCTKLENSKKENIKITCQKLIEKINVKRLFRKRKDIIKYIKQNIDDNYSEHELIFLNSLILIECYRKKAKKKSILAFCIKTKT